MNYPLVSVGQLVGSVIRRTGLKDTSLIVDINEWTAEAIQLMEVTMSLEKTFEENVKSSFHKAKYPCGTREIYGIEYCGHRLHYNKVIKDPRVNSFPDSFTSPTDMDGVFVSIPGKAITPNGNYVYTSGAFSLDNLPWSTRDWYKVDGRHIITSFEEGSMTVYYGKNPMDRDGFLMIPDEGNYKEALRMFIKARLSGRGYPDPDYSGKELDARFEVFSGRAKENITMPSVEEAEATLDNLITLLPNESYYESFFNTNF